MGKKVRFDPIVHQKEKKVLKPRANTLVTVAQKKRRFFTQRGNEINSQPPRGVRKKRKKKRRTDRARHTQQPLP